MGAELFKDPQGRSHRPAGARGGAAPGRADHAGDRPAAVCRHRHRHRLVPLQLDHRRHVSRYAGELVDAGAVPSEIYAALYEQDSLPRLQLRGRILARTQTELTAGWRTRRRLNEDFAETGALTS